MTTSEKTRGRAPLLTLALPLALVLAACGGGTATPAKSPAPRGDDALRPGRARREDLRGRVAVGVGPPVVRELPRSRACATRRPTRSPCSSGGADARSAGRPQCAVGRATSPSTPLLLRRRGTPTGGFFWDGARRTLPSRPTEPFLNPVEMANADDASVVAKLAARAVCRRVQAGLRRRRLRRRRATRSLRLRWRCSATSARTSSSAPFSSKYDEFLRGKRAAERARAARPGAVQLAGQGQLRGLPSVGAAPTAAAAVHRLQLRQPRRAAQRRDRPQRRPGVLRPRACASARG